MTAEVIFSVKGSTARRKDPACGTCRKKCRKCDREKPVCKRCRDKGLHCEGYPPRFQFTDVSAPIESPSPTHSGPRATSVLSARKSRVKSVSTPSSAETSIESPPQLTVTTTLGFSRSEGLGKSSFSAENVTTSQPKSLERLLSGPRSQDEPLAESLIWHFEKYISEALTISVDGLKNPFQEFVLPLARNHEGVLHALLGLSACHMSLSGRDESQECSTAALRHRVAALNCLGTLLTKEEVSRLTNIEEECVLAMVLLLVFHDICESGVSSHGAHLTGVAFLCARLATPTEFSTRSKASIFFISALTWLDMLRGFSGAEKLAYSDDVRLCVRDHGSLSLHTLVGCPPILFYRIGQVLEAGKAYLGGDINVDEFRVVLNDAERFLRAWDPNEAVYPTTQPEWRHLAEAYRHACLLRVLRFPNAFVIPCTDDRIKASVSAILDSCAAISRDSVFYKRLLFPLFLAGADTSSPHQMHYASWCISEIKQSTGFQHPAMTELLTKVWDSRQKNPPGGVNVPWMEFTCSELLRIQHAFLFF